MTPHSTSEPRLAEIIAKEYGALADLLESAPANAWNAPSLCEGWRTREVVTHVTMPARYTGPQFMKEMQATGGDFTLLSNTIAERDGSLPEAALLADLRSEQLHTWQPPGGGLEGALTHCIIHSLDITEAVPLDRNIPGASVLAVLDLLAGSDVANPFDVDLSGVQLRADDMAWSAGTGELVSGHGQALVCVLSRRRLPAGRLHGPGASRFSRR